MLIAFSYEQTVNAMVLSRIAHHDKLKPALSAGGFLVVYVTSPQAVPEAALPTFLWSPSPPDTLHLELHCSFQQWEVYISLFYIEINPAGETCKT